MVHGLNFHSVLQAYAAPLLALAVALACGGATRWGLPVGAAGAAALLVGWAALMPSSIRRALWPSATPAFLVLPALVAVLLGVARPMLGARLERWSPAGLAVFVGWWLAWTPAGHGEFWRVWLAVGLLAWLLSRSMAQQAVRGLAAALALWGGLVAVGAEPVWIGAALVAVAAAAGLLVAGPGAVLPPALLAGLAAAPVLGAGRLVRAGLNGIDCAALAACAAPLLAAGLLPRVGKRFGRFGPVVTALAGATLAVGLAWGAARLLRR